MLPRTMKAVRLFDYGKPEVLQYIDVPVPEIEHDEALVVELRLHRVDSEPPAEPEGTLQVWAGRVVAGPVPPVREDRPSLVGAAQSRELLDALQLGGLRKRGQGDAEERHDRHQTHRGEPGHGPSGDAPCAHAASASARRPSSHVSRKCSSVCGLALSKRSTSRRSASA